MCDSNAQPPCHYRIHAQISHVFPISAADGSGWQLLRAFPNAGKARLLHTEAELHFGERVAPFMEWALLRLHGAATAGALAPVRINRSDERRVGKGCVSTCSSRWSASHYKQN